MINSLRNGFEAAFMDSTIVSNLALRPEFVSNDRSQGRTVISAIERELKSCDEFYFSVAFITRGGLTPLLQTLQECERRGIKGKILTTDYLSFSEPYALEKLHSLKNIEIKMFRTEGEEEGFHTKGYIFKNKDTYRMIVGSSNMTARALKINHEWNTKLVGLETGELIGDVLKEFENLWNHPKSLSYDAFMEDYRIRYDAVKRQQAIAKRQAVISLDQYKLQPNQMQVQFIKNLKNLVKNNKNRALLLSATGTGKTYASAFGLRELAPKKTLFLVHREQIAKQALESYKKVFGEKQADGSARSFALLSGNTSRDLEHIKEADFIFATMQTMCKDDVLHAFSPDAFDAICLDEAHHSGANSYQKIMAYFTPGFWLGMTASPETNRFDVYEIFDHNIAYEIRLQQALEEDLLCPFHYFGITDISVDGTSISDTDSAAGLKNFTRLVSDDRVSYVIEQAAYYGYSGERVKGLVFCSRKEEARELSKKFNARGFRTEALTGEDSEARREIVIEQLVKDVDVNQPESAADYLDYIFTVDIFSEGVDIPEVNQVIMLRPTQSAIVFVQQLGRGLRKFQNKEFVVVLDFIGNYKNNFLIPIALSGDRSYNKDNIRRYVMEGDRVIPGISTIHFDEISRKRIFESIDAANFTDIKLIRENYTNLKFKLGRIPRLKDFADYGEMDVCRIFDNPSLGSYYKFLVKYEKEYTIRLSKEEEQFVEFISKKLASGKRVQELELLRQAQMYLRARSYEKCLLEAWRKQLQDSYDIATDACGENNVIRILTNAFPTSAAKKTYEKCVFLQQTDNEVRLSDAYISQAKNADFMEMVDELIAFGLDRHQEQYGNRYQDTDLVLYQKYTYEDVCRLLNWENNEVPLNIGGYKFDAKTKTFPVFINYDKEENISDTTKYEDHFVNQSTLIAISKSGRSLQSDDVQNFLRAKERGIAVHLFVRKNKDDKTSKEFYYLGKMHATGRAEEFQMPNTTKSAVEIEWMLHTPVREDLYQYLIG